MAIGSLSEVVVDCAEPLRLATFWAAVLGGEAVERTADWAYVDPPGCPRIAFQQVPEVKQVKNRLHLDVEVTHLAAAIETAERLGAVRDGEVVTDAQGRFQVMLDPEGNEWCLTN